MENICFKRKIRSPELSLGSTTNKQSKTVFKSFSLLGFFVVMERSLPTKTDSFLKHIFCISNQITALVAAFWNILGDF